MPEAVRGRIKKQRIMDGNYLTAGDLALIENRRGYGYGYYDAYDNDDPQRENHAENLVTEKSSFHTCKYSQY